MNSNTDLLLLNFNIRSIDTIFYRFNCFTNLLNKKIDILSFTEIWLKDNKNLCIIVGYDTFHNVRCLSVCVYKYIYLHIFDRSFGQSKDYFASRKKGTIQYGYRKLGTNAEVFSQTLAHGNRKNEIRQRQTKNSRREAWVWKEVKRALKKEVPMAYTA